MNYSESEKILEEIKKAEKILVNLHRGPDPDSYGSAFSLYYFLCSLGKEVDVVVTTKSRLSEDLVSFEDSKLVKSVDYSKFDFTKYDLFIIPDSGSWQQVVDDTQLKIPNIPIVVIDHHKSNDKFGKINLVEKDAASCAEMVYKLFEDWKFKVDKHVANLLLVGIIGDTGGFAFSNNPQPLRIAADLMEKGADKSKIIGRIFRTKKLQDVKAWGEYLVRMQLDEKHRFVWTAVSFEEYKKMGRPIKASSLVATMFSNIIDGTDFGIVMEEDYKNHLKIGLRSRSSFDVSKLAEELGGGGHKMAAGGQIDGLPFEKAVEKVLETAREYANKYKKTS